MTDSMHPVDMPVIWLNLSAADCGALHAQVQAAADAGIQGIYAEAADQTWNGTLTLGPAVLGAVANGPLPLCASVRTAKPDGLVAELAQEGCAMIALDAGAPVHLHRALTVIRGAGASPAVSLTPSAPLTQAEFLLAEADACILDALEPGQAQGTMLGPLCERLRILKDFVRGERGSKRLIVAGLQTPYEAAQAFAAGADVVILGETGLSKEGMRAFRDDLSARLKAQGNLA